MAKILFVSTWGSQCGIATYTERLAKNLFDLGNKVLVLAPNEPQTGMRDTPVEVPFRATWTRLGNLDVALTSYTDRVDIVHFQHEYGLFPVRAFFLQAVQAIRRQGTKVAITLHTVFAAKEAERYYGFLRQAADVIIVHTVQAAALLSAVPGHAQIALIIHGTPDPAGSADRAEGRAFLRVPQDGIIILAFGFLSPAKNLEQTFASYVEALYHGFYNAAGQKLNVRLLIVGASRDTAQYTTALSELIEYRFMQDCALLRDDFVGPKDVPKVFAAGDFAVLNTRSFNVFSASGQIHEHAAYGMPLAVVNAPIYSDAIQAGALPFTIDPEKPAVPTYASILALRALAGSARLRSEIGARMREYGLKTSWRHAAEEHDRLYAHILGSTEGKR